MSLWNESLNTFAANWLETLIRVCWQGGLALALAWAVCRLLPKIPAAGRCWIWRLAYLKLLIAVLWLPTLDLPLLPPTAATPAPALLTLSPEITEPALAAPAAADSLPTGTMRAEVVPSVAPPIVSTVVPTVAGWLLLLWIGALLWQGGQAIRQGLLVRRLRLSGTPLNGGPLDFWNLALCRDLNLSRVPLLLSSRATDTPLLIGILRPCIVLPESLLSTCTPDELRLVLAHELAHVERRDLLWGWLPLLARFLCGFHPLVLLAEREIGMTQEIACDETALHLTGAASAAYAGLLVRVAARFTPRPSQGFGMIGMTESYHTLKRRLSAMKSFPTAPRKYRVAIRMSLLTLGLAALMPWHVAAQSVPPPAPPSALPPAPAQTTPPARPGVLLPVPAAPASPVSPRALLPVPAQPPVPTQPPGVAPVPALPTVPARPRATRAAQADPTGAPPVRVRLQADPTGATPVRVRLQATPTVVLATPTPQATPAAAPQVLVTSPPASADAGSAPTTAVTLSPSGAVIINRRAARAGRSSSTVTYQNAATGSVNIVTRTGSAAPSSIYISQDAATSAVTISRSAPRRTRAAASQEDDATPAPQGYPMAAPGMISTPRPAATPSRAATSSARTSRIQARDPRNRVNPPAAVPLGVSPDPRVRGRGAYVTPADPTRAGFDPFTTTPQARGRRGVTSDPFVSPTPPAATGRGKFDPFLAPPATVPADPSVLPALPPGAQVDPSVRPVAPPRSLPSGQRTTPAVPPGVVPVDPAITPPVVIPPVPEVLIVQTLPRLASQQVPVLSELPILGRLFRVSTPPTITQFHPQIPVRIGTPILLPRSIPVLSELPILGRLFIVTPQVPVTPKPGQMP